MSIAGSVEEVLPTSSPLEERRRGARHGHFNETKEGSAFHLLAVNYLLSLYQHYYLPNMVQSLSVK